MNDASVVPEPPPEQIVILEEDSTRLAEWITFFKELSPRVKIRLPEESDFQDFLVRAEKALRKGRMIQDSYTLIDFPTKEQVAFTIQINSATPNSVVGVCDWGDVYFFCFYDISFSLRHFQWDGDAEEEDWATSYSLSHYSKELLQWKFIKNLIIGTLEDLAKQVPPLET